MTDVQTIDPYDWRTIEPSYSALLLEPLAPDQVPGWLLRWSDLERVIAEAQAAAFRAKNEDTSDVEAERRYQHLLKAIQPEAEQARQALKRRLLGVEHFEPQTEQHELLRRLQSETELFRETNVALQAEEQARAGAYFTITGTMTVTIDGDVLSVPQAEQRLLDPQRRTREDAWRAITAARMQARDALSALFLEMLPLRRQIARNADCADYRSYRWHELKRFDYTPEDTLALHAAIEKEIVPLAVRLVERRRTQLGVATLRPWDKRVDPLGRPPLHPFSTADELAAGVTRILSHVDPEFGDLLRRMGDGFLDLESRKDKALLGYQDFFPRSGMPYIFMNAAGSHLDVVILLHEAGHACHTFAANATQRLLWNIVDVPMEFNEVASQAMELLATPYLGATEDGFYTPEDARRAIDEQLDVVVGRLRGTVMSDTFQHWVYTEAPPDVTAAALDAKYAELHRHFFPEEDWSGLEAERGMQWQISPHIIALPFYMIEYTIAQLGALQIWRNALQDQRAAIRQYRAALALGGTRSLSELYHTAGARLTFDRASVAGLARLIATQLEIE